MDTEPRIWGYLKAEAPSLHLPDWETAVKNDEERERVRARDAADANLSKSKEQTDKATRAQLVSEYLKEGRVGIELNKIKYRIGLVVIEKAEFNSNPVKVPDAVTITSGSDILAFKTQKDADYYVNGVAKNWETIIKRRGLGDSEASVQSKLPFSWSELRGLVVFKEACEPSKWVDIAKAAIHSYWLQFGVVPNIPLIYPLYRGARGLQAGVEVSST